MHVLCEKNSNYISFSSNIIIHFTFGVIKFALLCIIKEAFKGKKNLWVLVNIEKEDEAELLRSVWSIFRL